MLLSLNGILGTPATYLNQPSTIHQPALVPASDYKFANLSLLNTARALPRLEIKDEASLLRMVKLPLIPATTSDRHSTQASLRFTQTQNTSNNSESNEIASSTAPLRLNASTRRRPAYKESSNESSNELSSESSSKSRSTTWSDEFSRSDNENESSPKNEFDNNIYVDPRKSSDVPGLPSSSTSRPNDQTSNGLVNGSNRFNGDDYENSNHLNGSPDRSSLNSINSNSPAQLDVTASEPISSPHLVSFSSTSLSNEISFSSSSSTSQQPFSPLQPQLAQPIALLISASKQLTDMLNSTKLPIKSILTTTKNNETMQKSLNSTLGAVGNTIAYEYPAYIRNTATVIFIIILIFGTVGNILVAVIIIRSKDLRNTTNYFLINLSIADLLVIIVCMPTVLIELHSKPEIWLLGEFMCKTIPYLEYASTNASILTMMAISFERFYAICKPLKVSYKCTKLRAVLIILGIWVIALLATLPLLFIAKQSLANYLDGSEVQVCLTQANDNWSKAFFLIIITLFFFLPLCVLVIIYVAITKRLCAKENISYAESVQMRARRQVVIMLATVIICFFICLLPFRLFTLFLLFISSQTLESLGMETFYVFLYSSRVMLYLNSALNPILYNLISSKFRNAFVQILCCRTLSSMNSRKLIRQSTFNTTTTTMSLTANSALNGFLNNSMVNFSSNDPNRCKRNSMQNCSLKQSHSVDTSLRQLNFQRSGRQASLQQFSSCGSGLFEVRDENANEIGLNSEQKEQKEPSDDSRSKIDRCNLFGDKKLIKQTSFAQNDENDRDLDEFEWSDRIGNCSNDKLESRTDRTGRSIRETADKSGASLSGRAEQASACTKSNVNKKYSLKYSTVTAQSCELKVATLEEDLNSIDSPNPPIELDGKKAKGKARLDLRLYRRIRDRLFDRAEARRRNRTNRARLITMNDKSNREIAKESITNEQCPGESSRESNV